MATFSTLVIQPNSGLSFPWAEYTPRVEATSDAHFGPEGVGLGMTMIINWSDLATAIQQILGYSWRDTRSGTSVLRRIIPFQHPAFTQLFAKAITRVVGLKNVGSQALQFGNPEKIGAGAVQPVSPGAVFVRALITIQFWRPPYYVRSDGDIIINGVQQEYLRYLDKKWRINSQLITQKSGQMVWRDLASGGLPPTKSQVVSHMKVSRTWYQIPEQCIFGTAEDGTLNGLPKNMLYTQTPAINPVTAFVSGIAPPTPTFSYNTYFQYNAGSPICGCVNVTQNLGLNGGREACAALNFVAVDATMTAGNLTITNVYFPVVYDLLPGYVATGFGVPRGSVVGEVNPPGGLPGYGSVVISQPVYYNATASATVTFENPQEMLFGCPTGTLMLEGIELDPQPLQMPAFLMQIPGFNGNEPISQTQYNVTFHFDYFDPPNGATEAFRGHNLFPYSGDALWYSAMAQLGPNNNTGGPFTTVFNYADFSDLFMPL